MSSLTNSQIATLRNINERPGRVSVFTVGTDYAEALQAAGYITIRRGCCYPTAAAAPFVGRSAVQLRNDEATARAALIGRWAAR